MSKKWENSSEVAGSKRQIPFRCDAEMETRLIKARGEWMNRTGKKISNNDFFVMLLEKGLGVVSTSRASGAGDFN